MNKEHPVTKIMHPLEDSDNYWISLKEASEYKMIMSGYDTILGSFSRKMFTEQKLKYQSDHNDISAAMAVSMARKDLELHLHTSPVRKNMRISGICGSEKGCLSGSWNCLSCGRVPVERGKGTGKGNS